MRITSIEPQKKSSEKLNIFIDEEFAFSLSAETVAYYRLSEGKILDDADTVSILKDSDRRLCLSRALKYISRQRSTEANLIKYLLSKGFSEDAVENSIEKLKEYKYIDDERYAKDYYLQNNISKGIRRIKFELAAKGVDIENLDIDSNDELERQSCLYIAQKYVKSHKVSDTLYQRLYRHLSSRGFSNDDIKDVIKTVLKEIPEEF